MNEDKSYINKNPMISIRKVTKEYNRIKKILDDQEKRSKINCYKCSCRYITKTIDVDKGTTPFMHTCFKCGNMAQSTFYTDIAPEQKPVEEWYFPTLKETLKMRKKQSDELEHVLMGGLIPRKI